MARGEDNGVSPIPFVIIGSILFLLLMGTLIWFAIPDPSARHHFVSPSGRVALDIGEICGSAGCERRIIAETIAPDGSKSRRGCDFSLAQTHPVLFNAYPLWAAGEQVVDIVYADADGEGGKFPLDIAADCTRTE